MCGHLNDDLFKKAYTFVDELKSQEISQMKLDARKTKDLEEKRRLQAQLTRLVITLT